MVSLACNLLNLQPGEHVLDLFCGLGNFSLPLARCVGETGQVIAVEGSEDMVKTCKLYFFQPILTVTLSDCIPL